MKKRILAIIVLCAMSVAAMLLSSACSPRVVKIAVPDDEVNQARALLMLEQAGFIELEEGTGMSATKDDIVDNPYAIEIVNGKSEDLTGMRDSVDFVVLNANSALQSDLSSEDALVTEDLIAESAEKYRNIVAVRKGEENTDKTRALVTLLQSATARDYLGSNFGNLIVPVDVVGNGEVQDADPENPTIRIGVMASPHAELVQEIKPLLENHGYTVGIVVYDDYAGANVDLSAGKLDANYFQDEASLLDYNAKNGTNLVSAGAVHYELMGLYPGKSKSLDEIR